MAKKKQKTIGKLIQEAQVVFNRYIRESKKEYPCIVCGKHHDKMDAGHYFPTSTHAGLRFCEDNVWPECRYDNHFNEGHLIAYRENLLQRIGQERFDALYERAAEYKRSGYKWSRSELEELIIKYKSLCK
jgi:hypothetical protein